MTCVTQSLESTLGDLFGDENTHLPIVPRDHTCGTTGAAHPAQHRWRRAPGEGLHRGPRPRTSAGRPEAEDPPVEGELGLQCVSDGGLVAESVPLTGVGAVLVVDPRFG